MRRERGWGWQGLAGARQALASVALATILSGTAMHSVARAKESSSTPRCNIKRLAMSDFSHDELAAELAVATEPVMLLSEGGSAASGGWPCASFEACVARHAQTSLGIATGARVGAVGAQQALKSSWVADRSAPLGVREAATEAEERNRTGTAVTLDMSMEDYVARLKSGSLPSADTYVFHDITDTDLAADFHMLHGLMARVRMAADSKVGPWQSELVETPGFIEGYPISTRLALGRSATGNSWHSHGPAMLALVAGHKRWLIMKPRMSGAVPLLEEAQMNGMPTKSWLAAAEAQSGDDSPWEAGAVWDCEQEAGEIIFVPDEFSHAVLNDGLVMGVAVQVDLGGTTALHDAAAWGKFGEQYATQLLQAGADPDTFSIVGYTPLHVAAARGQADVARLLISAGSDPQQQGAQDITALYLAAQRGHTQVAQALIDAADSTSSRGALLHQGVGGSGNTALHAAAFNGHEGMAQLLLDAGAEMRATTDGQRLTPLDYARHRQHTKVARLLRAHAQKKPKDKHRSSSKPGRKGRRSRRKKS